MRFNLILDPGAEESVTVIAHRRSDFTDRLEALVQRQAGLVQIAAYSEDGMTPLRIADIECITIEDGKTYAIDNVAKRYRLRYRLYELEELLPPFFIRINKSALANENRLERFTASFSGAVDAWFRCGYKEYVSRRCFKEIKRRLEQR